MAATACDHLMQPVAAGAAAAAEDHETKQKKSNTNQVVCFGELLVDFVPTVCGLALGDVPAFKTAPGGAPANVAVGICKLGGNAAFIGKIGDDEFGYALVKVLKKHGVETRGVRFESQARTALAFVSLRSDGERQFMFYRNPSADMLMVPGELDSELISSAGIFHYGSISLISEPCRSTHLAALKIAKEANVVLSYDPNLRLPLWSSPAAAREGIMSIWQQANIIKVSDEEVKFLTSSCSCSTPAAASDADHVQTAAAVLHDDDNDDDDDDETVLNCLWHPDLKLLLVTYGADGCRYYTPSFKGKVASLQVQAVDTTGAGDAFVAGLLSKLVQDFSLLQNEARLRQALQFANACGAITTTERGAIPALPDTHTVLRSLSSKLP